MAGSGVDAGCIWWQSEPLCRANMGCRTTAWPSTPPDRVLHAAHVTHVATNTVVHTRVLAVLCTLRLTQL